MRERVREGEGASSCERVRQQGTHYDKNTVITSVQNPYSTFSCWARQFCDWIIKGYSSRSPQLRVRGRLARGIRWQRWHTEEQKLHNYCTRKRGVSLETGNQEASRLTCNEQPCVASPLYTAHWSLLLTVAAVAAACLHSYA